MGGEEDKPNKQPYQRLETGGGATDRRRCALKYSDLQRLRTAVVLGILVFLLMHLIITTTSPPQQTGRGGRKLVYLRCFPYES